MRKVTTILCSIAFMISGVMMAITASDPSPGTGYKTMAAATVPQPYIQESPVIQNIGTIDLPEDLLRDLAKQKGVLDTVYITKTDTIEKQVTKVKWRKVTAPAPVIEVNVTASHRTDTIQVPVYYLATQMGIKEGPTGECISIYQIQKVDEICPEITNSSVKLSNESDIDVGE